MLNHFNTIIDDTIPTWQELGTQVYFGALLGMFLGTLIGLAVVL